MDVNGTKFHLLYGFEDWGRTRPQDEVAAGNDAPTLAERLAETEAARLPDFDWHPRTRSLRLARQNVIFQRGRRHAATPLTMDQRRGAGRDRYGHWYWIDERETGIRFLANGELTPVTFWDSTARGEVCVPPANGDFGACLPLATGPLRLRGLAVTTGHYLVVGDVTERGLLIFDLHQGGPPLLVQWPEATPFEPWDLAATPDGGVLILDRTHAMVWRLDRHFRLLADVTEDPALFQPEVPEGQPEPPANVQGRTVTPLGFSLSAQADPPPASPISVEPGPDGHFLVLDAPEDAASVIYEYDGAALVARFDLADALRVFEDDLDGSELFGVRAHDLVYVECCAEGDDDCPACLPLEITQTGDADQLRLIFVAERDGDQVIAFERSEDENGVPVLRALVDFLPLRRWQAKALVNAGGEIFYDFADRWVPLAIFGDCRYATRAVLWTPLDADPALANVPEQPLDSNQPGCVWHRLLLDAAIPAGTAVFVRARAADELDLLAQTAWQPQPNPYLRDSGAELPFYRPPLPADADDPAVRAGTWELLFQGVAGRYLQLELTLEGTGRSTPVLYAARAWYPRFSYPEHYLPAVYREDALSASFLERWLANFEGFFTFWEDSLDHLPRLLDPRSAPPDALEWLASWIGLLLDPLWSDQRRRLLIRFAHELYRWRGTARGLEMALRAYLDRDPQPGIFNPDAYSVVFSDSPVRIVEEFLTRPPTAPLSAAEATAHRFSVLVPHCLSDEDTAMVERLVALEKPAHTAYTIQRYWDLFRVGEARLGLDTLLGFGDRFEPLVLGESRVPGVYLQPPYPLDVPDRFILERDRPGDEREL